MRTGNIPGKLICIGDTKPGNTVVIHGSIIGRFYEIEILKLHHSIVLTSIGYYRNSFKIRMRTPELDAFIKRIKIRDYMKNETT